MIARILNKSMGRYKKQRNLVTGFTLVEVLLCMSLLLGLFLGGMSIYVYCFELQETTRNTNSVLNDVRAKLEEIRNSSFSSIVTTYSSKVFNLSAINGKMRTEAAYVTGSSNNLIDIRVVACWRQKGGRIIGEGKVDGLGNLVFSDLNSNGKIESPVELVTAISKKQ